QTLTGPSLFDLGYKGDIIGGIQRCDPVSEASGGRQVLADLLEPQACAAPQQARDLIDFVRLDRIQDTKQPTGIVR
ncbi:hypothetical protein, partial [Aureimonas ureilytica]|uniref:hypothetical protein n=1 Tax=Aureimonas ureilytica TaxID=401562 RepID=UPI0019D46D48